MQVYGFLEKAQLENVSADLSNTLAGLIWFNTTDGRARFYDGGAIRSVVDENSNQTLTGKTLTGNTIASFSPDGVQTITAPAVSGALLVDQHTLNYMDFLHQTTPAAPAVGGIRVYAKNDNNLYKQDAEGNEVQIGTGGGGLDIFFTEDFSVNNAADMDSGNNATFLGGGTIQGALSDFTDSEGNRQLRYTQAAGSLNDYFSGPAFPVPVKARNNKSSAKFVYTYTGDAGDIKPEVYDVTNGSSLVSDVVLLESGSTYQKFEIFVDVPSSCAQLRWGFQTKVENAGAILTVDDIQFNADALAPGEYFANSEPEEYTPSFGVGLGSVSSIETYFYRRGKFLHVYGVAQSGTVSGSDGGISLPSGLNIDTSEIAPSSLGGAGQIMGSWAANVGNGSGNMIVNTNTSTSIVYMSENQGPSGSLNKSAVSVSSQVMTSNEPFSFNFKVPIQGWSDISEGIAVAGRLNDADWQPYDLNLIQGLSSPSGAAFWRRDGSDLLIEGRVSGTVVAATQAQLVLPNGLSTSSQYGPSRNNVGNYAREVTTGSNGGLLLSQASSNFIGLGTPSTWSSAGVPALSYQNMFDIVASGEAFSFRARVKIEGWSASNAVAVFPAGLQNPKAYIKDIKGSGVNGGTFTSGSWIERDLNNLEQVGGNFVTLSSNRFTLPAGEYEIHSKAPARGVVNKHTSRLLSTDSSVKIVGTSSRAGGADDYTHSYIDGTFTITEEKTFKIEHQCQTTRATDGLGESSSFDDSVYTVVEITKRS